MKVKKKQNNNLVLVTEGNKKQYFTSKNRAGLYLGLACASVEYAIKKRNEFWGDNGERITIEIVDGSEVPYKLINNH